MIIVTNSCLLKYTENSSAELCVFRASDKVLFEVPSFYLVKGLLCSWKSRALADTSDSVGQDAQILWLRANFSLYQPIYIYRNIYISPHRENPPNDHKDSSTHHTRLTDVCKLSV